jgi:hypothetical protein
MGTEYVKIPVDDEREFYDNASGPKEFWVLDEVKHEIGIAIPEVGYTTYIDKMHAFLTERAPCCLGL